MAVGVKVRGLGPYALFTRPEMKVERCSYDVITPSCSKGNFGGGILASVG